MARIELKYCPSISFYIKANYTSWGKNFKVTDGKLTYADGSAIQTKGGYYVKPLSVGDKLGLIYWDGDTTMNLQSISTVSTKANLDPAHPAPGAKVWVCYIIKGQSTTIDTEGLGLVSRDWVTIVPRKQLLSKSLMKAGTLDLTPCELTIESFQDTPGLQNHIWHVI